MNKIILLALVGTLFFATSCKKKKADEPQTTGNKLIVKLIINPLQDRLGNSGFPSIISPSNGSQTPVFNGISAHYLELSPSPTTALGAGAIAYLAPETTAGGSKGIDFSRSIVKSSGETYIEIPLTNIRPGSYQWVRLSLNYQNYDIKYSIGGVEYTGTVASFLGYNQYLTSVRVKTQSLAVNANQRQGFWAFESTIGGNTFVRSGLAPEGATTVPNPLFATSPIPQGSCIVTGKFDNNLVITGTETKDIVLNLSLSNNNSFEWVDVNGNGKLDFDNGSGENIVDMGIRGLKPSWQ